MKCSGKRTFKEISEEVDEEFSHSPSIDSAIYEDTTSYHYNSDGKEAPLRRGRGASTGLRKEVKGKFLSIYLHRGVMD